MGEGGKREHRERRKEKKFLPNTPTLLLPLPLFFLLSKRSAELKIGTKRRGLKLFFAAAADRLNKTQGNSSLLLGNCRAPTAFPPSPTLLYSPIEEGRNKLSAFLF